MTNTGTGFLLAYTGAPLSKTAAVAGIETDDGEHGAWVDTDTDRQQGWKRYAASGAAGGAVGYGVSSIWGKLSDKPDVRRDLFMLIGGAAAGIAGDAATHIKGQIY